MATYYEILEVDPSASTAEILEKYDEKFDEWQQLTTNHNPEVAEEANNNIRLLEKVRNTLIDEKAMKTYDDSLIAGELKDPDAEVQNNYKGPLTKTNYRGQVKEYPNERTNAWICTNPKCGAVNSIGSLFCKNCSTQIGIECPKCGKLVELKNKFCPNCRVNLKEAIAEKRFQDELRFEEQRKQEQIHQKEIKEEEHRKW